MNPPNTPTLVADASLAEALKPLQNFAEACEDSCVPSTLNSRILTRVFVGIFVELF